MSQESYGITVPALGVRAADQIEYAREAERLGYGSIWTAEGSFIDSFTLVGSLAEATSLPLGTAIVPVYNRTPFVLAMSAATAALLSGNRFSLGLGSSSETIISGWNGIPLERPLRRMRETLEIVGKLLDGERVDFEGETLRASQAVLEEVPTTRVPIYLGALNKRMLRLAGELTDGVIVNYLLPEQMPILVDEVRAGARRVGRDPSEPKVILRLPMLPGAELDEGRAYARRQFGPYVAAGGYNNFFRSIGFEEEAEAVAAAFAARDRAATEAAISDRLADAMLLTGSYEDIHRRIAEYREAGADSVVLWPHAKDRDRAFELLRALAPDAVGA